MIKLEGITVEKGGSTILDDVSLSMGQGGITALIGPNGAGKSTFLHSIAGWCPRSAAGSRSRGWTWCAPTRCNAPTGWPC